MLKEISPIRRVIIIFCFIAMLGVDGLICTSNTRYDGTYEHLKDLDLKQLKDQGNTHITRHEPESALACYMMVTSRYSDRMDAADKMLVCSAYNNAAYVYTLIYSDYSLAYQFLLKSLKLARDNGFYDIEPYIYLNLGNIYFIYEDYTNALAYYKKSYSLAKEEEDTDDVVSTTFANIILTPPGIFDESEVRAIVKDYMKSGKREGKLHALNDAACDMAELYFNNDLDGALAKLNDARKSIDTKYLPERYNNSLDYWESMLLQQQGKYDEALSILKRKALGTTDGDLIIIYKYISRLYDNRQMRDSADYYKMEAINLRDSVLRNQNYALIRDMRSSFELQEFEQNIKDVETRRKQHERIAIILLVNVVILSVFIVILVRKNRRLNEALTDLYHKNRPESATDLSDDKTEESSDADTSVTTDDKSLPAEERQGFKLDEETCRNIMGRIIETLQRDDVITQCGFTIKKLSDLISTHERYISYVLNKYMHKNFNTILNEYRIEKARHILADANAMKSLTVEGVAMSLGFKSRSNFANIFKKLTGLTPSEYRDIAREENKGN